MAYRNCHRVGGVIGFRGASEFQNIFHHDLNLFFFCSAVSGEGLLHLKGSIGLKENTWFFLISYKITPRAWATVIAVFKFLKKKRSSMAASAGLCFLISEPISRPISTSRSASELNLLVLMHPQAMSRGFLFFFFNHRPAGRGCAGVDAKNSQFRVLQSFFLFDSREMGVSGHKITRECGANEKRI